MFFEPPLPPCNVAKKDLLHSSGYNYNKSATLLGGKGDINRTKAFFLILLFDMQILKKNISCVATILLRIAVYNNYYCKSAAILQFTLLNRKTNNGRLYSFLFFQVKFDNIFSKVPW